MSIIDKALAAVTPPVSDEARAKATQKARAAAGAGDWLSLALDHHDQIRAGFEACRVASPGPERIGALKQLAVIFVGHSQAEEIVLYPAMAKEGDKRHATEAYTEQVTAKMQMAELERIDPTTQDWLDKLEHIRGAVLTHIYQEENEWFIDLKQEYEDQAFLNQRFNEEFERYVGGAGGAMQEPRSFQTGIDPRATM